MTKKTKAELKKQLWRVFSRYIRIRDKGKCISCGKIAARWQDCDAGHFIPAGSCGIMLYFDERNVNCQCTTCNRWKHGNLSAYAWALERKYGAGMMEELWAIKGNNVGARWTTDKFEDKIKYYEDLLEELKNE